MLDYSVAPDRAISCSALAHLWDVFAKAFEEELSGQVEEEKKIENLNGGIWIIVG